MGRCPMCNADDHVEPRIEVCTARLLDWIARLKGDLAALHDEESHTRTLFQQEKERAVRAEKELGEHISWGNKAVNERDKIRIEVDHLVSLVRGIGDRAGGLSLLEQQLIEKALAAVKGGG